MKQTFFATVFLSVIFFSCNNGDTGGASAQDDVNAAAAGAGVSADPDGKTGTFSFDGKEVGGNVETQYFGAGKETSNFSVLCQHNESNDPSNANFELLQVTFVNEKDAATNPSLKIYQGGSSLPMTEPEPGIVAVSLSGVGNGLTGSEFSGSEKSSGIITVTDRTITIKDLSLFTREGDKKVVNATLPF